MPLDYSPGTVSNYKVRLKKLVKVLPRVPEGPDKEAVLKEIKRLEKITGVTAEEMLTQRRGRPRNLARNWEGVETEIEAADEEEKSALALEELIVRSQGSITNYTKQIRGLKPMIHKARGEERSKLVAQALLLCEKLPEPDKGTLMKEIYEANEFSEEAVEQRVKEVLNVTEENTNNS